MWTDIVSLFGHIKDVIYELYSAEWFMTKVVYAYRMINKSQKANEYIIYIHLDRRENSGKRYLKKLVLITNL